MKITIEILIWLAFVYWLLSPKWSVSRNPPAIKNTKAWEQDYPYALDLDDEEEDL